MATLSAARQFLSDVPKDAQQLILTALGNYNSLKTAAKIARVSPAKLRSYFSYAKAQLDDPAFMAEDYTSEELALFEFYQACCVLEATAENEAVTHIRNAAAKDWKAAALLLRQRNPEDWGDKQSTAAPSEQPSQLGSAAQGLLNSPVLDLNLLSADELVELERLLKKATPVNEIVDNTPVRPALPDKVVFTGS